MGSPFVNFLPFIYTTKWCCCKATLATVTQPHSGTPCKGYKAGSQSAEAQSCNCPLVLKSKLCIRNFVVWISMAAYLLQVQVAQYFCPYNVSYLNSKYTGVEMVVKYQSALLKCKLSLSRIGHYMINSILVHWHHWGQTITFYVCPSTTLIYLLLK